MSVASSMAPETAAIEDVTWTVAAGDYWVVGGLTGTGKSDLLATAAGLQRPLRGTHLLFGEDLASLDETAVIQMRLRVGLVFENGGRLFHRLTVAENVALPLCYQRGGSMAEAKDQAEQILELTELSMLARHTAGRIARNWRPRVALARALVLEPEVLLLDNPLAGLDPRQTHWWLEFLARLSQGLRPWPDRKMTLVVATDDFRPWKDQGRQFALIKNKSWHSLGGTEALSSSEEPLLRELLAAEFTEP
ncbi:MAG: ATP-binding cassette domain-containing protein [Chloroflexi bacterium]|nr:ATP-binding cassette domain-containing protein [Chloroflexota bacterium]